MEGVGKSVRKLVDFEKAVVLTTCCEGRRVHPWTSWRCSGRSVDVPRRNYLNITDSPQA